MSWKKLILIFSLVILSACAENSSKDEIIQNLEQIEPVPTVGEQLVDAALANREWILATLDGEPLIHGTNIILAFDGSFFSGFAGCNAYGGQVEISEDGYIKFGEIASQTEGCIEPEGVLDQENTYLDLLLRMEKYHTDDSELTLSNSENGQILVYKLREPIEMDPAMLDNSRWNLLPSDDFPLIEGSEITLSFLNGKIGGFGGCRNYQGEYKADGDEIRFPMIMMLDEVCDYEDLLPQEEKFTTALELSIHYQVQDDQLTLFQATGETIIFEREE
jgi:heat shock protein HslJ